MTPDQRLRNALEKAIFDQESFVRRLERDVTTADNIAIKENLENWIKHINNNIEEGRQAIIA